MFRYLLVVMTIIVTSFYFFPFEFVFLPNINTKMILAGFGLLIYGIELAEHKAKINKDIFTLSLVAMSLSVLSLITMVYNVTKDNSFLTYFISAWVWLGGAYTAVHLMKWVHGYLSVSLICNYLISVCVVQCILAYMMTIYTPLKDFVDSFLGGEEAFMGKAGDRMYGIGCALDVAGMRFAAILIMIAFISVHSLHHNKFRTLLYVVAFIIIGIVGNMIGRSATVGMGIVVIYWAIMFLNENTRKNTNIVQLLKILGILLLAIIPLIIFMYYVDPVFKEKIRFGFEGFFALAETGKWQTGSNDILLNHMIVFPESLKTWLIGDGYCANPASDMYYTGPSYHGFYMGTDIGYLRFLFYFGIFGIVFLICFICKAAFICVRRFPLYKEMFLMLLMVNLILWFKASTDIFLVFAPFLCLTSEDYIQQNTNQNKLIS